jgi:hypothetical protein
MIRRYLSPVDRLGEVLFGLIMALCLTGAVRLGLEEATNRELLVAVLGCNVAWAIVDGVMYVLASLFERGRRARLTREVASAPTDAAALERLAAEVDGPLSDLLTPEERDRLHRHVLPVLRRGGAARASLRREDLLGAVAVALIIVLATLPVVAPLVVVTDPDVAVRLSNLVALALVFLVGVQWGRMVGASPLGIGAGLTALGVALVLITIALGG